MKGSRCSLFGDRPCCRLGYGSLGQAPSGRFPVLCWPQFFFRTHALTDWELEST